MTQANHWVHSSKRRSLPINAPGQHCHPTSLIRRAPRPLHRAGPFRTRPCACDRGASLTFPIGPPGGVLLTALFLSARPSPSPRIRLVVPSVRPRTAHPSCRRHGPERKREAEQEGATSHCEQAPPSQGPMQLSAQRLVRNCPSPPTCLKTTSLRHFPESASYLICAKFSVT